MSPPITPATPGGGPGASRDTGEAISSFTLVPLGGQPLDDIAEHIDGAFVVVVKVTGGRYRRRCFLTAASAERAARNALDAGYDAQIYLAQLKPLWKLTGGTVAS